jgi:hypothetical protein
MNTRSAGDPDALFARSAIREERYLTAPVMPEPETAWDETQAWLVYALVPDNSVCAMEVLVWCERIGNTEGDVESWMDDFNAEIGKRTARDAPRIKKLDATRARRSGASTSRRS